MEARIARIESDIAHLRSDVAKIKADTRALRDRVDTRADRLESKLDGQFIRSMSLHLALAAGSSARWRADSAGSDSVANREQR